MFTRWTALQGYDSDILDAIRSVLSGPSAIVSKVTRLGFTTSAAAIAKAEGSKILIVGPTKKISTDTVRGADGGTLIAYGHSHCLKLQKNFAHDPFMEKLPLSLPSPCPCEEHPECDLTNAWFESAPVRAMTYAKLTSLMLVDSDESSYIKEQLSDLDVVVFDESHRISLPAPPMVDLDYSPERMLQGFEALREIYSRFLKLKQTLYEDLVCKSIEDDLEYAGTNCRLARLVNNSYDVPSLKLRAAFSELIKLARQRKKLNYSEPDILFLKDLCSVMADRELCVSFVRGSEGDRWLLVGTHNVEQNAIKSFLKEVCPNAKAFFVSGTQFESRPRLFEELADRKLESVCVPDVKDNNSSMTIYADSWKADTINLGPKMEDICRRIRDISELENGAPIYLATINTKMKLWLESTLKGELPNIEFDYYRSARSIGVENSARIGIFIGFPATPTNSMDFAAPTYEASQELRHFEALSSAWQTMSRIKDWEGKVLSRAYCIGLTQKQVSQIVTQGKNLRAHFVRKGEVEITVDEALTMPKILVPYKKQVHAEQRKSSPFIRKIWDTAGELDGCKIPIYSIKKIVANFTKTTYNITYVDLVKNSPIFLDPDSVLAFGAIFSNPKNEDEWRVTSDTLDRFFRSNKLCHAEQRSNATYYPHTTGDWQSLVESMFCNEVTIATYGIGEAGHTVQCAFDIDNHKGTNPALPRVNAVIDHIKAQGAQPILVASGSPDSYHIHIPIMETQIETSHEFMKAMHNELKQAHKDLDLKHDTETFPKQKTSNGKKVGNALKLPLALNRKSGMRAQILDPNTKEPADVIFITKVIEIRQPEKEAVVVCNRQYLPAPKILAAHPGRSGTMRPCVSAALNQQLDGSEGNDMRVAIACEALASGKSREEIIDLFMGQVDFNEVKTAQYVDYIIAAEYRPWRCETLQDRCPSLIDCSNCPMRRDEAISKRGIVLEPVMAR
jgi:hypothetical protein